MSLMHIIIDDIAYAFLLIAGFGAIHRAYREQEVTDGIFGMFVIFLVVLRILA